MNAHERPRGAGRTRRLFGLLGGLVVVVTLLASVTTMIGLAVLTSRGDQVMVVTSGSMMPTFAAGDAVLVRPAHADDLRRGTVITYHAVGEPEQLTTHRIVARRAMPGGLFLQTQGDANATPDPNYVPAGAVVGIMSTSAPKLGYWLDFFQSRQGRLVVLGTPLLLLVGGQVRATVRELRRTASPRRGRGLQLATAAVVVVSLGAGAVLARTTSALFTEQSPITANAFATVNYCDATTTYSAAVLADSPTFYHRFSEVSGTTAGTAVGTNTGIYTGGYTLGVPGATACESSSRAVRLNGSSGHVIRTATGAVAAPTTAFSLEVWFRATTGGGKLVGFGTQRSAASGANNTDRHLYLSNAGALYFGVNRASRTVISSGTTTYLDGRWHHAVGTYADTGGMRLYVDGTLVASNTGSNLDGNVSQTGFWRIGYDSLTSWTGAGNLFFNGDLDEVAVYATAQLTAARVTAHYTEARR